MRYLSFLTRFVRYVVAFRMEGQMIMGGA